eukprot:scaffold25750_cov146-Isochrysis_galbana.AAC.7
MPLCGSSLFSTRGVGDILCEIAAKEFHLFFPPRTLECKGTRVPKYIGRRASLASRVNAARLALDLEDLARFEGSDPQLSFFRRRLDGTLATCYCRSVGECRFYGIYRDASIYIHTIALDRSRVCEDSGV